MDDNRQCDQQDSDFHDVDREDANAESPHRGVQDDDGNNGSPHGSPHGSSGNSVPKSEDETLAPDESAQGDDHVLYM